MPSWTKFKEKTKANLGLPVRENDKAAVGCAEPPAAIPNPSETLLPGASIDLANKTQTISFAPSIGTSASGKNADSTPPKAATIVENKPTSGLPDLWEIALSGLEIGDRAKLLEFRNRKNSSLKPEEHPSSDVDSILDHASKILAEDKNKKWRPVSVV
jgi:hypothetical protein